MDKETRPLLTIDTGGSAINVERTASDQPAKRVDGFGLRRISFIGGFCLLLNNMTGPGMVQIPVLYSQAGWLLPTILMILIMVISTFASTMMTEAMTLTPGNRRLQKRMELEGLTKMLFGKWGYRATVILLLICLQATNIASIVVSAQVMDYALVAMKGSCGLEVYPKFHGVCVESEGTDISPFGNVYIVSLGFIVVLLMSVPLGYFNLEDNIYVQVVATVLMIIIIIEWIICFAILGVHPSTVPAIGEWDNVVTAVGTVVFNYAFVVTVPSWVNEKRAAVSVNKSLWWANVAATVLFLIIGFGGSWAFQFSGSNNILDAINTAVGLPRWLQVFSQVAVYLFPIVVLVSGIPVYSIIVRYNLLESHLCGKAWANFWGVVVPWLVAVPFYTGNGLSNIIAWTGLFVNGVINFIIPFILYIKARKAHSTWRATDLPSTVDCCDPAGEVGLVEDLHSVPLGVQKWLRLSTMRVAVIALVITIVLLLFAIVVDIYYASIGTNVLGG